MALFGSVPFRVLLDLLTEDSAGNSSQNILVENCKFSSPGSTLPQENLIIGGSGAVLGCDFHDGDTAIRMYGKGLFLAGNRGEQCNNHYLIGTDSAGNPQAASGFVILGGSTEGCTIGLDMGGPGLGVCSGFFVEVSNLGHSTSGYPTGVQASQYGIHVRANCANSGVFYGSGSGQWIDVAGIQIDNSSSRANLVFISCSPQVSVGTGVPWVPPTNAYTATFLNCSEDAGSGSVGFNPIWTFSQLPSGGNVLEGDEFNISDGTNSLTWGQTETATGTHTTHRLVRWNGSNYTI